MNQTQTRVMRQITPKPTTHPMRMAMASVGCSPRNPSAIAAGKTRKPQVYDHHGRNTSAFPPLKTVGAIS